MRTRRPLAAALLSLGLAGGLVGGCGSASEPTGPTGVDGLVIPTPSPRPADFTAGVDNPWLTWQPGAEFAYDRVGEGAEAGGSSSLDATVTMVVGSRTEQVGGLAATSLTTAAPEGTSIDWFAQDTGGNVWWVGREGEWEAGRDGAEAGLFMPAEPRVGDGFRTALAGGVVEERVEVLEVSAEVTPLRTLRLGSRSELSPGVVAERTYVEGRGLTRVVSTTTAPGSSYALELRSS